MIEGDRASRTASAAETRGRANGAVVAQTLGGEAMRFEHFENHIQEVDILIAATSAPQTLIRQDQVRRWMKARHAKPLFLIDIAVPRNIEPAVEKMDNVYLYNIDDLQSVASKNMPMRKDQLERCFGLVDNQTEHFMRWLMKEFGAPSFHA